MQVGLHCDLCVRERERKAKPCFVANIPFKNLAGRPILQGTYMISGRGLWSWEKSERFSLIAEWRTGRGPCFMWMSCHIVWIRAESSARQNMIALSKYPSRGSSFTRFIKLTRANTWKTNTSQGFQAPVSFINLYTFLYVCDVSVMCVWWVGRCGWCGGGVDVMCVCVWGGGGAKVCAAYD